MNALKEYKGHPDRSHFIVAKYSILEGSFHDIIERIGSGGLYIKTKRRIALGQPVSTSFPLIKFKNTIQVSGRVTRIDPNGFLVTFHEPVSGLVRKEGHFPEII